MAVKDRKGGVFLVESLEKAPMHDDDRCVHNLVPDGSAAFMSGGRLWVFSLHVLRSNIV
jgi:hypothetical protein